MEIFLFVAAIALIAFFLVSQYNKLIRLNVQVDEAFAQIEVQLQRRADLIPNLVETVKGYASHERETFEKVTEARAKSQSANGIADVAAVQKLEHQRRHRIDARIA